MATTTFDKPVGSNQVLTSDIVDNLNSTDATKVLSAKQGKTLSDQIAITNVSDWHNFAPLTGDQNRRYGYSSSASTSNMPITGNCTIFGWCEGWSNYYVVHVIVHYAADSQYINSEWNCYYQNGTWIGWERVSAYPSRRYNLSQNQTCTFTLSNYAAVKVICIGYDTNSIGEIILRRDSANLINIPIKSVSNLGVSMNSSGVVTLTCNYQYGLSVKIEQESGNVTF